MTNFIEATPKLARILAGENLTVVHGAYETASFDTENRVLKLPIFKEDTTTKDMYTLFVSHEVGHALYTPKDWSHDIEKDIPGCPHVILNIVEDIRIEKLIRRNYSGLYRTYVSGYKALWDKDFFGVAQYDISKLGFLNRLNLHAKAGSVISVPFNKDEQKMVDLAMAIETWQDTIRITKALAQFAEEAEKVRWGGMGEGEPQDGDEESEGGASAETQPGDDEAEGSGEGEGSEGDADGQDASGKPAGQDGKKDQGKAKKAKKVEGENTSGKPASAPEAESGKNAGMEPPADMILHTDLSTDRNYRNAEDKLTHGTGVRVLRVRGKDVKRNVADNGGLSPANKRAFKEFQKNYNPFIMRMVNEFNIRQAARKMLKTAETKTGTIDPLKLTEYQYNEDIFKSYGIDPQSTNHAVCMFVDSSSSMADSNRLQYVLIQTAIMASFCRKVGIPFVVYGWTSGYSYGHRPRSSEYYNDISAGRLTVWVDSTMSLGRFRNAIGGIYDAFRGRVNIQMGGTPLTEVKAAMAYLGPQYKRRTQADKLHMILLTDGCGYGNLYDAAGSAQRSDYFSAYNVQVEGCKPKTFNLPKANDERIFDALIKDQANTYMHIDVDSGSGSNVCTYKENDVTDGHAYDRTITVPAGLRRWACVKTEPSADRGSEAYREFRKMSGMIGKFVA